MESSHPRIRFPGTGTYQSQFVTGTSNGGLTAHPGGERWRWESRIFGGIYDDVSPGQRPVYGALNHRDRPVGGSPRFGSVHFRLRAGVLSRTTFCYPDSVFEPTAFAVADRCNLIELAEREAQEEHGKHRRDPLDDYIEAHVHGGLHVDRDVEALVLDPSFRGTQTEERARLLACPVEWHEGFRLSVDHLRQHAAGYRGPQYVALGTALAVDGHLTPAIIGDAAQTSRHDVQELKRLWHSLARFGAPRSVGW